MIKKNVKIRGKNSSDFPLAKRRPIKWANIFSRIAYLDLKFTNEAVNDIMAPQNLSWSAGSKTNLLDFYNNFKIYYYYNDGYAGRYERKKKKAGIPVYSKPFVPPRYLYFLSNNWTPYYYSLFQAAVLWRKKNKIATLKKKMSKKLEKHQIFSARVRKNNVVKLFYLNNFINNKFLLAKNKTFLSVFNNNKRLKKLWIYRKPAKKWNRSKKNFKRLKNYFVKFSKNPGEKLNLLKKHSKKKSKQFFYKKYFDKNFKINLLKVVRVHKIAVNSQQQKMRIISGYKSKFLKKRDFKTNYHNTRIYVKKFNCFRKIQNKNVLFKTIKKNFIKKEFSNKIEISDFNLIISNKKKFILKKLYLQNLKKTKPKKVKNPLTFNTSKIRLKKIIYFLKVLKQKQKSSFFETKTKRFVKNKITFSKKKLSRQLKTRKNWRFYEPFKLLDYHFPKKKIRLLQLLGLLLNWKPAIKTLKKPNFLITTYKKLDKIAKMKNPSKKKLKITFRKKLFLNKLNENSFFYKTKLFNKKHKNKYTVKKHKIVFKKQYKAKFFRSTIVFKPWRDKKLVNIIKNRNNIFFLSGTANFYKKFFAKFINKKNYNFKIFLHSNQLKHMNFARLKKSHRLGSFSLQKKIYFLQLAKWYLWSHKVLPLVRKWQNHYIVYKFDHTQKNPYKYYSISRWDQKSNRWLSPVAHNRKLFWHHLPTKITLETRHPHRYKSYKPYKIYLRTMNNQWDYGFRAKYNQRIKQILFGKIILPAFDYLKKNQFLAIKKNTSRVKPLGLQHSRPALFLGKFERRIDILTYKLNFAPTIQWARSFVKSGLIYVSSLSIWQTKDYKNMLTKNQRYPMFKSLYRIINFHNTNFFDSAQIKFTNLSERQWTMPTAITLPAYRVKLKSIIHWSSRNIRSLFFKKLCKRCLPQYFIYNKNKTIAYFWRNLNLVDFDRQRSSTRIKWNTIKWLM